MTEKEYRAAEGINKSTLWEIRKSPAHYQYLLSHQREDTAALKMGRAIHAAVLTPTAYEREWVIIPDGIDRRTKSGREEYEQLMTLAEGKETISAQDAQTVKAIASAIRKNKSAHDLLKGTRRERPIFWEDDDGNKCKCRIDAMKPGIIIDLKTTTDASTEAFTREAFKYGYDVQAAHYIEGYQAANGGKTPVWYFIAVEKTEPYAVNILKAGTDFIDHGAVTRRKLIQLLRKCQEADSFPDYGINEIIMPKWMEG